MGRLVALALLASFSFPLTAPLWLARAGSAAAEAKLPACCRRSGEHRCGMAGGSKASSPAHGGLILRGQPSQCPLYPSDAAAPAFARAEAAPATGPIVTPAPTLAAITVTEQAEAFYRVSFSRSSQQRGPPALFS